MAQALPSLVISDGRRGIENQALGLAEGLGRYLPLDITVNKLSPSNVFRRLPPFLQLSIKPFLHQYGLENTTPRLVIGCGRQAIAPLLSLKRKYRADVFTIYIQHPRINPSNFDLVIAPEHDGLNGENVINMIGSPHRITEERLKEAVEEMQCKFDYLPSPRIAVLIGGNSKTRQLDKDTHQKHISALCRLADQGASLLITTSRRTPEFANKDYKNFAKERSNIVFYDGHNPQGENPYFAYLGTADAILVTEDSTNMLVEACSTAKPVFRLPMAGKPKKFQILYDALEKLCHVRVYDGSIEAKPYPALLETQRIAKLIASQFGSAFT